MARQLWSDPNEAQAIELLQQPAKARAAAVQQIADAQSRATEIGANASAQAAQQGGQAWAGAAQQIGQIPNQIQAAREQSMKMQLGQQQVAAGAQQASDLKALDAAFQMPGGRDAIINSLPGHLRPAITKQFNDADESSAKVQEAQLAAETATNSYVTGLAETVKSHGYDPAATQLALTHAKTTFKNNTSLLNQLSQMEQALQSNPSPDTVKSLVDPILAAHDAQEKPVILPATPRGGAPAQLIKPGSGQVVASGTAAPEAPTEASIAMQAAGGDASTAIGMLKPAPKGPNAQAESFLLDGKPVKGAFVPDAQGGKYLFNGEDVTARVKPIPPASMTINPAMVPSGDALDMAAKKYLATGDLPSMGMGQAGVAARIAVMNRAAAIDPAASLAANKAVYGADSKNLANLQRTEGTLSAFENTAGKNLDQFLSLADKIPDTGVPWLNQPIRTVNSKLLGSDDQAAFNAARDVALREIARVTNDPKLAGVLSDAARKEVSSLAPADATFGQIKAVAKVLKQDMANVHAGINEQIGTVKAGLQGNPATPATTQTPTLRYNPATGKVEPIK